VTVDIAELRGWVYPREHGHGTQLFYLLVGEAVGTILARSKRMIQLTTEQLQALDRPQEPPPRVIDPRTQQTFVLLPLEDYQRLVDDDVHDGSPWTDEERDMLRVEVCRMLDSFGKAA
jgi:hypothetical protein